ncbi:MAG: tetratricopeptide repeat protein, partial [Chloroflexi bacterium]|nr:tetratricopeptide repeat protein [Chloroflexota bacterium]
MPWRPNAYRHPARGDGTCGALRPERALAPIAISPDDVEDAVNSAPNDFNLRMEAAGYYLQHGLFPQAVHDLQAAVHIRPKSGIATIALADALSAGGQQAQALETYRQAVDLTSGSALAYRGLGQLFVREGKLEDAQKAFEAGLKRNPGNPDIEIALGNLYLVLQKNSQAGAVLAPAARQRPEDAEVHYLLGLVDERNLHINAALKETQTAAALDPSLYEAWGSIGLYQAKLEHYSQARAALSRATRLAPHVARYHQLLGDAFVKDLSSPGNVERGIQCYYRALAADPNDVKSLISLGTALTDRNLPADRKAAIPVLKRVIALRPADKEPLYRLAQVYRG